MRLLIDVSFQMRCTRRQPFCAIQNERENGLHIRRWGLPDAICRYSAAPRAITALVCRLALGNTSFRTAGVWPHVCGERHPRASSATDDIELALPRENAFFFATFLLHTIHLVLAIELRLSRRQIGAARRSIVFISTAAIPQPRLNAFVPIVFETVGGIRIVAYLRLDRRNRKHRQTGHKKCGCKAHGSVPPRSAMYCCP